MIHVATIRLGIHDDGTPVELDHEQRLAFIHWKLARQADGSLRWEGCRYVREVQHAVA